MGFPVQLSIELDSVSHFLEQNLTDIDVEISNIDSKWDESQAQTEDDYGNLMYRPMIREQITLRATFYELNALIEHHLQSFALEPYSKSAKRAATPKSIFDVPESEFHRLRFVNDLKIDEIRRLIERYYEFSFETIPQYTAIQHIREIANSFKHRRGFKDFRRDSKAGLTDRHELTREKARQAIRNTREFLIAVFHEVSRSESATIHPSENGNGA